MLVKETSFTINNQKIAAKIWHAEKGIPTLALHGWLDNASSFDQLAPLLPHAHIVAIDMPGHGHSDHLPSCTIMHLIDHVVYAIQLADQLGWKQFALLGHSLGACIATLIAGAVPTRILHGIFIDALGPMTTSADHSVHQLRFFLENMALRSKKSPPRYASQAQALQARLKATPMSETAALALVARGTKQLDDGQWTWRTDPRLLMPTAIQLTEEQVHAFLREISAPVCIIRPDTGFPFSPEIIKARIELLKHVSIYQIPGLHHVHMDTPQAVADCIHQFLEIS